jgi:hypothetical protein
MSDRILANSISRRSTPTISSLRLPIPSGLGTNTSHSVRSPPSCSAQHQHTLSMQPWALVTPASRGIGLELARRLLRTTDIPIVTSARKDLDQTRENVLSGLDGVSEDRLHVVKVDVLGTFLGMSLRLRNSHLHAMSHRRTNDHRCSLNNHIHVPKKVLLPPPRARGPRHPIPRKVAQPDRLQQCPAHLPGQYSRSHDATQALLALPAQKSHNNRRTQRPPAKSRVGQHERTRRKYRR